MILASNLIVFGFWGAFFSWYRSNILGFLRLSRYSFALIQNVTFYYLPVLKSLTPPVARVLCPYSYFSTILYTHIQYIRTMYLHIKYTCTVRTRKRRTNTFYRIHTTGQYRSLVLFLPFPLLLLRVPSSLSSSLY